MLRKTLVTLLGGACWLVTERTATAQSLLAQSGVAKTMIGWLLVFLCVGLGLLVVCRPSTRRPADEDRR